MTKATLNRQIVRLTKTRQIVKENGKWRKS
jgi:hypothetical protein